MLKALADKVENQRGREMTPAEIRAVMLQLARNKIPEHAARPAIDAFNKIMCDAGAASQLLRKAEGKRGR